MAHGITEFDAGIVGFASELGKTWHGLEQYKQINGAVPFPEAREALGYEVVKVPLAFHSVDMPGLDGIHGNLVDTPNMIGREGANGKMYALVRTDHNIAVYGQSVSDSYEIFSNSLFLDNLENQIMCDHPDLEIESCGSLWGGRIAFVNILLDNFQVKKDVSKTLTRIMFYNAFGGRSISGCCHNTRIVCNNTLMIAEAQGAVNNSLKKFKHTKMSVQKVTDHLIDMVELHELANARKEAMNWMADKEMNQKEIDNFLGHLFPIEDKASSTSMTRRLNSRDQIQQLFSTIPDIQGAIKNTRYAMLNTVTYYSQHVNLNKSTDQASSFWDVATGGVRHKLNQTAYDLLVNPEIPEVVKTPELVLN